MAAGYAAARPPAMGLFAITAENESRPADPAQRIVDRPGGIAVQVVVELASPVGIIEVARSKTVAPPTKRAGGRERGDEA